MNEWLTLCALALAPLLPAPVVELRGDPFSPRLTWQGLGDRDLIARTILAEAGARVNDDRYQLDAFGVGWVVWNRTRTQDPFAFEYGRNNVYAIVTAPNQFVAMRREGNAARAADPDSYWRWCGAQPSDGRRAYWTAFSMADCIVRGKTGDPTEGALFFSDHRYTETGDIENYPDGRTRFRVYFSEPSRLVNQPRVTEFSDPPRPGEMERK